MTVLTIYGYQDSEAERYAIDNGFFFETPHGDIDGEGTISIADVLMVQKHLSKVIDLTKEQLKAADTDENGKITLNDVLIIQKYIAKIIDFI